MPLQAGNVHVQHACTVKLPVERKIHAARENTRDSLVTRVTCLQVFSGKDED